MNQCLKSLNQGLIVDKKGDENALLAIRKLKSGDFKFLEESSVRNDGDIPSLDLGVMGTCLLIGLIVVVVARVAWMECTPLCD